MRILFVISEDWYFVTHRLHLAQKAISSGYQVGIVTNVTRYHDLIVSSGIEVYDWGMDRRSMNPYKEYKAIIKLLNYIKSFEPEIIHAVALKPVIYTAIISRLISISACVYALGGLGYIFTSKKLKARLLRPIITALIRFLLNSKPHQLIVQNENDLQTLLSLKISTSQKIKLIRGAGVNIDAYYPNPKKIDPPLVILPARMLWQKGIADFVSLSRKIRSKGISSRFALIGSPDEHNPNSIAADQLMKWDKDGDVEWWGHRDDMPEVYQSSSIVCLPTSYGEGLPKSLLEAASSALPVVAYDIPGCREIVNNGLNGFLVNKHDLNALTDAVAILLNDPELRLRMGEAGRRLVIDNFSESIVADETLSVWNALIAQSDKLNAN